MNNTLLVLIICQGSAVILNTACINQKTYLEKNDKYLSPKEKSRYKSKIRFFVFFEKLLKYGSVIYFVLFFILNFLQLFLN